MGALRAVCVVLEGPGNTLEFRCILGPPLGPQDSEHMELEGKKRRFVGYKNNHIAGFQD